jgi:phosphoglycolate phosphatase
MTQGFVIFDFDGTLVDSAPSILHGLEYAFQQNNLTPLLPLDSRLIGPPLHQTLLNLTENIDKDLFQDLLNCFKHIHDRESFLVTHPYPNIAALLQSLYLHDIELWIATNKRWHPTQLILQKLGWIELFKGVYCLDQFPECNNKSLIIEQLIHHHSLNGKKGCVVGDTDTDAAAAEYNNLPFLHACWGYQKNIAFKKKVIHCDTPQGLLTSILHTLNLSQ